MAFVVTGRLGSILVPAQSSPDGVDRLVGWSFLGGKFIIYLFAILFV